MTPQTRSPAAGSRPLDLISDRGATADALFWALCRLAALTILALAVALVVVILVEAWPAITGLGISFLLSDRWSPSTQQFGALSFIYGTLWTSGLAMLIAVPLGVGAAAFLAEIAPPAIRRAGSFLIELLAAIPSVVYGFWAMLFLAPLTRDFFLIMGAPANVSGKSMFTAGLILSIMILPYITAITFEACRAVPLSQRQGSLALGASRWQTIWNVALPFARPGIVGGCFLALGRALGETMAVIMVIGNTAQIDPAPYALGATIPSQIALGLNELGGIRRAALVELGAMLLLVTIIVNCVARAMIWRMGRLGVKSWFTEQLGALLWSFAVPGAALLLVSYMGIRLVNKAGRIGLANVDVLLLALAIGSAAALIGVVLRRQLRHSPRGAFLVNRLMTAVLGLSLALASAPLFLILGFVAFKGAAALDLDFFTRLPNAVHDPGLAHAVVGSVILVALATVFAVPIALLAAVFLSETPHSKLATVVRFVGELLGGVPSIVVGVFAYALLVAPEGWLSLGHFTAWAGAFALGLLMIPITLRGSEEALKLVPQSLRQASHALGAARWQTVVYALVPAARPAIITALCLAMARIAGETAPLLVTVNQTSYWPRSLNQDFPYLTYYIYNYSTSTDPEEQRLAWAAAFVLLALVMAVNLGIRFLAGKRELQASRAD
jgi:phosphate transport system permease protein